jgi:hypothetical protein
VKILENMNSRTINKLVEEEPSPQEHSLKVIEEVGAMMKVNLRLQIDLIIKRMVKAKDKAMEEIIIKIKKVMTIISRENLRIKIMVIEIKKIIKIEMIKVIKKKINTKSHKIITEKEILIKLLQHLTNLNISKSTYPSLR